MNILDRYLATPTQRQFFDRLHLRHACHKADAEFLLRVLRDLGGLTPQSASAGQGVNTSMDNELTYSTDDLLENSKLRLAILLVQEACAVGPEADKFRTAWPNEVAEYLDWLGSSGVHPAFEYRDNWSECGTFSEITCHFVFTNSVDAVHFKLRWL